MVLEVDAGVEPPTKELIIAPRDGPPELDEELEVLEVAGAIKFVSDF